MPRPQRCRRICSEPEYLRFMPDGIPGAEQICLSVDEFEVIRLVDLEKMTHEQCAQHMDVSRTTVTEIYESARYKLADSLINGKELLITGGQYKVCERSDMSGCASGCVWTCRSEKILKEENIMRIAVSYDNGQVFQHFGHTAQFKLYDVDAGMVVSEQVLDTNGRGHSALAGLLVENKVDVLICGGIGGGAQAALAAAGIKLFGGVTGSADEAAKAFVEGRLVYQPDVHCDHHDHEQGHGEHQCGEHGCGRHG